VVAYYVLHADLYVHFTLLEFMNQLYHSVCYSRLCNSDAYANLLHYYAALKRWKLEDRSLSSVTTKLLVPQPSTVHYSVIRCLHEAIAATIAPCKHAITFCWYAGTAVAFWAILYVNLVNGRHVLLLLTTALFGVQSSTATDAGNRNALSQPASATISPRVRFS